MKLDKTIRQFIVDNNRENERKAFSSQACLSEKADRRYPERENVPDHENIRPAFFHDTDRIIHSRVYSRYIDKTQVFYLFENDHVTHRVLHVQFVSKIGRVIGRSLKLNEDLIEAIALGHDLGHVPYGHDGEAILSDLCEERGAGVFVHNAQSVRALMEIENRGSGLNLSLQVLDGILAHNGEFVDREYRPEPGKTWEKFLLEYSESFKDKKYGRKIVPMTMEGCVMRITDVIAYVGRDFEDAITIKLVKREDLPAAIAKTLGDNNKDIIDTLVSDLIENSYGKDHLRFSHDVYQALQDLKAFNYEKIYFHPVLKASIPLIKNQFKSLLDKYIEELKSGSPETTIFKSFLHGMNREYQENTPLERKAVDFIAGMTDDFFNNQYQEHFLPRKFGYTLEDKRR